MIITLKQKHKDALRMMIGRQEFPAFVDWIKTQKSNIAILEWSRTKYDDPDLKVKKAKFEGNVEIIDLFLKTFEKVANETKEEDEKDEQSI